MHVCVSVCVSSSQLGRVSVEYLVGSNQSVYSQVVREWDSTRPWSRAKGCLSPASPDRLEAWMSQKNASQDWNTEKKQIQKRQTNPSQTWAKTIPAA